MDDWNWVEAIGSVVGGVAGFAAFIVSIKAYLYAKKVDYRTVDIRRDELINDISILLEKIPAQINEANQSKAGNFIAKGLFQSRAKNAWDQSIAELNANISAHKAEFEEALNEKKDRVLQLKKLDRLKKVLHHHLDWLNVSLKEDREEVLSRMK